MPSWAGDVTAMYVASFATVFTAANAVIGPMHVVVKLIKEIPKVLSHDNVSQEELKVFLNARDLPESQLTPNPHDEQSRMKDSNENDLVPTNGQHGEVNGNDGSACITLEMNMEFESAGEEGSEARARFTENLQKDLGGATNIAASRFEVTKLSRGSVIATISILPDVAGETMDSAEVAHFLETQSKDPNSLLYTGIVTRFVSRLQAHTKKAAEHVLAEYVPKRTPHQNLPGTLQGAACENIEDETNKRSCILRNSAMDSEVKQTANVTSKFENKTRTMSPEMKQLILKAAQKNMLVSISDSDATLLPRSHVRDLRIQLSASVLLSDFESPPRLSEKITGLTRLPKSLSPSRLPEPADSHSAIPSRESRSHSRNESIHLDKGSLVVPSSELVKHEKKATEIPERKWGSGKLHLHELDSVEVDSEDSSESPEDSGGSAQETRTTQETPEELHEKVMNAIAAKSPELLEYSLMKTPRLDHLAALNTPNPSTTYPHLADVADTAHAMPMSVNEIRDSRDIPDINPHSFIAQLAVSPRATGSLPPIPISPPITMIPRVIPLVSKIADEKSVGSRAFGTTGDCRVWVELPVEQMPMHQRLSLARASRDTMSAAMPSSRLSVSPISRVVSPRISPGSRKHLCASGMEFYSTQPKSPRSTIPVSIPLPQFLSPPTSASLYPTSRQTEMSTQSQTGRPPYNNQDKAHPPAILPSPRSRSSDNTYTPHPAPLPAILLSPRSRSSDAPPSIQAPPGFGGSIPFDPWSLHSGVPAEPDADKRGGGGGGGGGGNLFTDFGDIMQEARVKLSASLTPIYPKGIRIPGTTTSSPSAEPAMPEALASVHIVNSSLWRGGGAGLPICKQDSVPNDSVLTRILRL
jgi:hypothetical protein